MDSSVQAALTLGRLRGIGRSRLRRILETIATNEITPQELVAIAKAVTKAPPSSEAVHRAWRQAEAVTTRCLRQEVRVVAYGSSAYPSALGRLPDPPAILFMMGRFEDSLVRRVAVVGTRRASAAGRRATRTVVGDLASAPTVVVSGLALGIDTVAHGAAIEFALPTWAVLAHGLDTVYPPRNRELARVILDHGGALISEYEPGAKPTRYSFIERDRIQAGLSDMVVIIETEIDGGAMHTARFALEAGIPVYVANLAHQPPVPRDRSRSGADRAASKLLQLGARPLGELAGERGGTHAHDGRQPRQQRLW